MRLQRRGRTGPRGQPEQQCGGDAAFGKCVARKTLSLLKGAASDDVFRKIVWGNAHRLLRIPV
jgi:hypothetical protein